jgi:hypothetical protein
MAEILSDIQILASGHHMHSQLALSVIFFAKKFYKFALVSCINITELMIGTL